MLSIRSKRALGFSALAWLLLFSLAGCSSSSNGGGGGGSGGGDGAIDGAGNCEAPVPFGGDPCKSLQASDFSPFNYTLDSTKLMNGFGGPDQTNTQCLYNISDITNGDQAQPGVGYGSECDWEGTQQVESKATSDQYKVLSGIGDAAFEFWSFGSLVIFVKDKGYVVIVSAGEFSPYPAGEEKATNDLLNDVLARL